MARNNGFTRIEIILVVVTIIIIGGLGLFGYIRFIAPSGKAVQTLQPADPLKAPIVIDGVSDLNSVQKDLDQAALDDSDNSELDKAASDF